MKKLLVLIVLLSAPIFAENWDREQLNFKVQTKDVHYRYRHYFGESDKTHHQLGYKYDNWQFSYQYIEKKGRIEHRPRVSVKLFKQDNGFYFRPRVEYRDIEGKKGKGNTYYFRVLTTLGYKGDFKCNTDLVCIAPQVHFSPRFAFARDGVDDGDFEDIQTDIMLNIKFGKKFTIRPGVRYIVDDDYNTDKLYATLQLSVKF